MIRHRPALALLLALVLAPLAAFAAAAQDSGGLARREKLARRYLEKSRWKETYLEKAVAGLREAEAAGKAAPGFAARFAKVADLDALVTEVARVLRDRVDESSLDGAVEDLEERGTKRFDAGPQPLLDEVDRKCRYWFLEARLATMKSLAETPATDEEKGAAAGKKDGEEEAGPESPGEGAEDGSGNGKAGSAEEETREPTLAEKEVVTFLREIAAAQNQARLSVAIDVDGDRLGEYATLMELAGTVGVRAQFDRPRGGSGFSALGKPINPPLLPAVVGRDVDGEGMVVRYGYLVRVLLPGVEARAKFVYESGPPPHPAIVGRSPLVGINSSEIAWCAYAWPEKRGPTGSRAFFVNQAGQVLRSPNVRVGWEGRERPIRPDAALTGMTLTSPAAAGTVGRDGEVWKVVE